MCQACGALCPVCNIHTLYSTGSDMSQAYGTPWVHHALCVTIPICHSRELSMHKGKVRVAAAFLFVTYRAWCISALCHNRLGTHVFPFIEPNEIYIYILQGRKWGIKGNQPFFLLLLWLFLRILLFKSKTETADGTQRDHPRTEPLKEVCPS